MEAAVLAALAVLVVAFWTSIGKSPTRAAIVFSQEAARFARSTITAPTGPQRRTCHERHV